MAVAPAMISRLNRLSSIPGGALGDTVAHGGDAAGNLGCAAYSVGRPLYELRVFTQRLVCREHVVVSVDNANIGGLSQCQACFSFSSQAAKPWARLLQDSSPRKGPLLRISSMRCR